jgi:hypothetical protein
MPRLPLATTAVVIAFMAAGCSGSTMTESEAETQIEAALENDNGLTIDEVDCPDDITAEVDETMTCEVTAEGETAKVKMTITSVEGDTAKFDVEVVE